MTTIHSLVPAKDNEFDDIFLQYTPLIPLVSELAAYFEHNSITKGTLKHSPFHPKTKTPHSSIECWLTIKLLMLIQQKRCYCSIAFALFFQFSVWLDKTSKSMYIKMNITANCFTYYYDFIRNASNIPLMEFYVGNNDIAAILHLYIFCKGTYLMLWYGFWYDFRCCLCLDDTSVGNDYKL